MVEILKAIEMRLQVFSLMAMMGVGASHLGYVNREGGQGINGIAIDAVFSTTFETPIVVSLNVSSTVKFTVNSLWHNTDTYGSIMLGRTESSETSPGFFYYNTFKILDVVTSKLQP